MSAQIIGTVQTVIGHVIAVNKDGEVRELKSGDVLFQGETIKTGPDGSATVLYANGLSQTIDSDADIKLNLAMADFMTAHAVMPMHPLTSAIHSAVLVESGLPKLFPDLKLAPMLASEGDHAAYVRPYLEPLGLVESGYPTHGIPFGKMYAEDIKGWPFLHHEIPLIPPVLLGREVTVYESGLPDGSNQSVGVTVSGGFTITDPSHVIQLFDALHINGGAPVLLSALNNFHVITPHGDLTLNYDNTTHTFSFSYELTSPVDKLLAPEQDVFSLSLSAGSFTVNGQLIVDIIDDKPSVNMLVDGEFDANLLTHDANTIGAAFDTASANFSSAFSALPIYGADGAGSTVLSYSFNLLNSISGLKSDGVDINLFKVGDMIIGTTAGFAPSSIDPLDPSLIFTIAVNGSGNVTLTQYAQLDHPLPGVSSNYDGQHLLLPGDLIQLVANATTLDSDGVLADRAFASANLDLGGRVLFADDGPSIVVSVRDDSAALLTTHDHNTISGSDTATANFSNLFFVSALNAGADVPNPAVLQTYALSLLVSGDNHAKDSLGNNLQSHGVDIHLYKIGNVIVGSTDTSSPLSATDPSVVFSIAVGSGGDVTLTQYAQVDHFVSTSSSYSSDLDILGSGLVGLQSTITVFDFDGDSASDNKSIDLGGNIQFADDGPFVLVEARAGANTDLSVMMVTNDHDAVYSSPSTASANFSGYFLSDTNYGADGPAASNSLVVSYSLSLTTPGEASGLASHGVGINLYEIGGVVVGSTASSLGGVNLSNTIFSIAVDSSTGEVTLRQYAQLDHSLSTSIAYSVDRDVLGSGLVNLVATATATDFDGDTATNSNHIDLGGTIKFADDGPSVVMNVSSDAAVTLTTHDASTISTNSDIATANFSSLFTPVPNYGADGAGSVVISNYSLAVNSATSGLSSSGLSIFLYLISGMVVGSTASSVGNVTANNTIFSIGVDNAGTVTLTQYAQIDHATPGSNSSYDTQLATLANGLVSLMATATATDFDGDTATGSNSIDLGGNIQFADAGPSLSVNNLDVYRTVSATTVGTYTFDVGADTQSFANSFGSGALMWTNAAGFGGTLTYDALHSTGTSQLYHGMVGSTAFFDITVNNDGTYDFTLLNAAPTITVDSGSLFGSISGGSGLASYTFAASNFNGVFKLVLTAYDDKPGADTLNISSTELGINGNSIQQQFGETLRLDVQQQPGYENTTLSSLTIGVAATGSLSTGDQLQVVIHYTTGSDVTLPVSYDGSGSVHFTIDPARTVDYVDFSAITDHVNFKVTGISLDYSSVINPADDLLNFQLTGKDYDQDTASSSFTVNVMAGTSGNDNLVTGGANDQLSGGAGNDTLNSDGGNDIVNGGSGNDTIIGGSGNDTLTGGTGADTFTWQSGNQGTIATPAVDTVMDFSMTEADKIDLSSLLPSGAVSNPQNYLQFSTNGSGDAVLKIDVAGAVSGSNYEQEIVFHNVSMATLAGAPAPTSADVINNMITTSHLVV